MPEERRGLGQALMSAYRPINDARVTLRDRFARYAGLLGGADGDPAHEAHRDVSRNLTSQLGRVLPPQLAANVADMGGLANEALTGGLQGILGNPVQSSIGWDWADIQENRKGQDEALKDLEQPQPMTPSRALIGGAQDAFGWTLADKAARWLAGR